MFSFQESTKLFMPSSAMGGTVELVQCTKTLHQAKLQTSTKAPARIQLRMLIIAQNRNHYSLLPKKICRPPITVSTCASWEIQTAEASALPLISALPFVGPRSSKI